MQNIGHSSGLPVKSGRSYNFRTLAEPTLDCTGAHDDWVANDGGGTYVVWLSGWSAFKGGKKVGTLCEYEEQLGVVPCGSGGGNIDEGQEYGVRCSISVPVDMAMAVAVVVVVELIDGVLALAEVVSADVEIVGKTFVF